MNNFNFLVSKVFGGLYASNINDTLKLAIFKDCGFKFSECTSVLSNSAVINQ